MLDILKKKPLASFLFAVLFFVFFAAPVSGWASSINFPNPTATNTWQELVANITNWLLAILSGVAILVLIIGGITYITAEGEQDRIDRGKRIITYAIFGLAVVLVSYSIVLTVNAIIFGI